VTSKQTISSAHIPRSQNFNNKLDAQGISKTDPKVLSLFTQLLEILDQNSYSTSINTELS